MGQLGFFDAEKRLAALSAKGDPLEAIDRLVGKTGRSAFIAEAAEQALRRRRLLEAFDQAAGSLAEAEISGWETSEAAEEWVRNLRRTGTREEWADTAERGQS